MRTWKWWVGFGIAVVVTVVVLVGVGFWFGHRSPSDQPQEVSSTSNREPSAEGPQLVASEKDVRKVGAEIYDLGVNNGLEKKGIRVVTREDLRQLADEGIKKYSRYGRDPTTNQSD